MRLLWSVPLRARLVVGLLLVVIIPGLTATVIGIHFINDGIVRQAQDKVRLDLNTAREVYYGHIRDIKTLLEFSAIRPSIWNSLATGDKALLQSTLSGIYEQAGLDILNITDADLQVVFRCRTPEFSGDSQHSNSIVAEAWETGRSVGATQIFLPDGLVKEGEDLAERAFIRILPTPKARPIERSESTSGMMMMAATPVLDESGRKLGVIYGGHMLNKEYSTVDRIKSIVYQAQKYEDKDIGTSTIFQGDTRISTNVLTQNGERAIGTRVSAEVNDRVLVEGRRWVDRAFVVNDWYITAYEPIRDIVGNVIGILYVGILEKPYDDLRSKISLIFLGVTTLGIVLALTISYFPSRSILNPIDELAQGTKRLASGDLDYRIPAPSRDEIGRVCEAFNRLGKSLLDRDRALWENTQRQLERSDRLAAVGHLAAGVAHEINNPLTGVLTFACLLLEEQDLPETVREDLQTIVHETTRCRQIVRNLLDFARETTPQISLVSINQLLGKTLNIVRKQSLFLNVTIEEQLRPDLPEIPTDTNQLEQVIMNLVLNAAEAMPDGGKLTISTNYGADRRFIKISIQDTGIGIPKDDLERIFDPFYTTKAPGKGTGLGLATSYGIVQAHKGTITVTSQVGEGSTFEINLPVAQEHDCDEHETEH